MQRQDVVYLEGGLLSHRRTLTDLQPWDLARIPGGPDWATTLREEVQKITADMDATQGADYILRTLVVSSACGQIKYNWASNRRGGPTLDSTPGFGEFPLRVSRASKFARRT